MKVKKTILWIVAGIFPFMVCGKLVLYPFPEGEILSSDYTITINGKPVSAYLARVSAMPVNQVWPGYQRPLEQTELASFCYFDTDKTATIEVISAVTVEKIVIRPLSDNIKPTVKGNRITFKITRSGQYVVEVNGWHKALHLFVNPVEKNPQTSAEKNDLYFGPGIHRPGIIHAKNDQTIYIAGGAIVHGLIYADQVKNVKIRGRGILDASTFRRSEARNIIYINRSRNISVEGIILRDAHTWTMIVHNSEEVFADNIKLIGHWRYNSDGIDIVNSSNVILKNSFVRAFDDCVVLKGSLSDIRSVSGIVVENCVLWNDWGRALEIGAETATDSIFNCTFRNCDIIHYVHVALDIQNGDRAHIYNITFEDIRVEDPIVENSYYDNSKTPILDITKAKTYNPLNTSNPAEMGRLFDINIRKNNYSKDSLRGKVDNIMFRNIRFNSAHKAKSYFSGYSADHAVNDIFFKNVFINGVPVKDAASAAFTVNEFVNNLIFK